MAPRLVRLGQLLARKGLCSRREADGYIRQGRVLVNGDRFSPQGVDWRVPAEVHVALAPGAASEKGGLLNVVLHKPVSFHSAPGPRGPRAQREARSLLVAANRQPSCRDRTSSPVWLPAQLGVLPKLAVAGRLDADSSGVLIFSQDGAVCRHVVHVDSWCEKEYAVHVRRDNIDHDAVARRLSRDRLVLPGDGRPLRRRARVWWASDNELRVVLTEGRHRQVRRMAALEGLEVLHLVRTRIGGLTLGGLRPGQWRVFRPEDLSPKLCSRD